MDEAYGPSIAFIATFLLLNVFQCAFGLRRIRLLERRVWALENTTPEPTVVTQPAPQTTVSTYTNPNYTYAAPPTTYGYYQQPSAPPQATTYYQDPQALTGRIY